MCSELSPADEYVLGPISNLTFALLNLLSYDFTFKIIGISNRESPPLFNLKSNTILSYSCESSFLKTSLVNSSILYSPFSAHELYLINKLFPFSSV